MEHSSDAFLSAAVEAATQGDKEKIITIIKQLMGSREFWKRLASNKIENKAIQDAEYWHSTAMRLTKDLDETCRVVDAVLTELDNIDNYADRLDKYGEEDKAEGLLEASARIRNTMQKALDCPAEKEGE